MADRELIQERDIEPIPAEPAKPQPVPPPAVHQWAMGDSITLKVGHKYAGRSGKIVGFQHEGSLRVFVVNVGDQEFAWAGPYYMELVQSAKVELVPQPTPANPATILYRVEYRTSKDVVDLDSEGNWEPSVVASSKAAIGPVACIAERMRLGHVLGLLDEVSDTEEPQDAFIVKLLGGHTVEPYEPGDHVTILGGPHTGKDFYLVERDEANGQRWWMAAEPGGVGTLGLHVDGFGRAEGGRK